MTGQPPVQILDVTGPLEVFANAPGYDLQLASPDDDTALRTNRGISLGGTRPLSQCTGPIDTLILAGGSGAESKAFDPKLIQWIRDAADRSRRVASICTGAFLLAEAGLLHQKKPSPTGDSATTSPSLHPRLSARDRHEPRPVRRPHESQGGPADHRQLRQRPERGRRRLRIRLLLGNPQLRLDRLTFHERGQTQPSLIVCIR